MAAVQARRGVQLHPSCGAGEWRLSPATRAARPSAPFFSAPAPAASETRDELIFSASEDGTVRVWDSYSGEELRILLHPGPVFRVTRGANGQIATGCVDGVARVWEEDGSFVTECRGHNGPIYGLRFAKDGRLFTASGDGTVSEWRGGKCAWARGVHSGPVFCVDLDAEEERLVAGMENGSVYFWHAGAEWGAEIPAHAQAVFRATFSADGRWLATASADGTVKLAPIVCSDQDLDWLLRESFSWLAEYFELHPREQEELSVLLKHARGGVSSKVAAPETQ